MFIEPPQYYGVGYSDIDSGVQKTTPISTSDTDYNLEDLKIHLDLNMGDHSYMQNSPGHHTQDEFYTETSLPLRAFSSGTPTTGACTTPDTTNIHSSTVPFSYSYNYDSSLPTPVSVIGSPSLSDKASIKMEHSFSNTGMGSQQPTPPGTARPSVSDWFNNNNNNNQGQPGIRTIQSSSPLTLNPSDLLGMHSLNTTHSSAQRNLPGASGNYHFRSYGVSDPQDNLSSPIVSSALFPATSHVNPSALRNYQLSTTSQVPLAPAPPVPILGSTPYAGVHGAPVTPIEGMSHFGGPLMIGVHPSHKRTARKQMSKRGQAKKRQRGNNRRQPSRKEPKDYDGGDDDVDDDDDDEELFQEEYSSPNHGMGQKPPPKLELRYNPDKPLDKELFKLREEYLHLKGRGMWEKIVEEWEKRYGERKNRASLQMQITRAVAWGAIWSEEEDRALKEAIAEYDRRRYQDILKIMKEKGGCRIWDWKPEHIAKRLAELGEEEYDPESKPKNIRRRRKEVQRQRSQQPNLLYQSSPAPVIYDERGLSMETRVNLTAEQEEQLFQNLWQPENETPEPEPMEFSEANKISRRASTEQSLSQVGSERVAKQACEMMITHQQQHHENLSYYGNQFPGSEDLPHMT